MSTVVSIEGQLSNDQVQSTICKMRGLRSMKSYMYMYTYPSPNITSQIENRAISVNLQQKTLNLVG